MSGMRFPAWLVVLVASVAICSVVAAQTAAERIGLITSALRSGQFDKALQLLQPELQRSPKNPQLWTFRGIALSGKGDKKEALNAFRHALENSPDYLPALEGAAQIEYENGGADAVSLLQRILHLRPNDPTSHAMLAVLAYRRGDCAGAARVSPDHGALRAAGSNMTKPKLISRRPTNWIPSTLNPYDARKIQLGLRISF